MVNQAPLSLLLRPILAIVLLVVNAQCDATELWQNSNNQAKSLANAKLRVQAVNTRHLQINTSELTHLFSDVNSAIDMILPLPNGLSIPIHLTPSPILSADLADQYPAFMTYKASQLDQPENMGRFSISHLGLFGLFRYNGNWMLLSPIYQSDTREYASYWYQDEIKQANPLTTRLDYLLTDDDISEPQFAQKSIETGDSIRTYKLAISTTAEYTQRLGGTSENVVAELMNLVNRINQILLIDLALQFELVDNQDIIFFDVQNDPFTNADAASDIEINQRVIDDAVGSQNYDIGHVLGTNGGGLAYVGVICNNSFKAQGYTGIGNPQGERFYIDLVIHELGHQLGARHSFNAINSGSCADGRSNSSAYEPGSGSTIMAYAGICDEQDLQSISDPYFHSISIQNIRNHVESFPARNCGVDSNINNAKPQIQLDITTHNIPANTPFVLKATATDLDNDPLTFSWEQYDNGGSQGATSNLNELNSDNGFNPLFRSFNPVTTAQRYFPKLNDVLAGRTSKGETYATTDRDMRFRLTVRDNKGGVEQQDVVVSVTSSSETFNLNPQQLWTGLSEQSITWQQGGTHTAPINCSNVDILLDAKNDREFDITLASGTANDGQHTIIVPNIVSDNARLMMQCSDNIFYTVTTQGFTIIAVGPVAPVIDSQIPLSLAEDSQLDIKLTDLKVTDNDSSYPEDFTLSIFAGTNYSLNQSTLIPEANFNGVLSVNVQVNDGELDSNIFALQILVTAVNDAPLANNDNRVVQQNSGQITIDVLANDQDIDNDSLTIFSVNYLGQGEVIFTDSQISYTPANGFAGTESFTYVVTDGELSAQGTVIVQVNAAVIENNGESGGSLYLLTLLCFLCFSARVDWHLLLRGNYD